MAQHLSSVEHVFLWWGYLAEPSVSGGCGTAWLSAHASAGILPCSLAKFTGFHWGLGLPSWWCFDICRKAHMPQLAPESLAPPSPSSAPALLWTIPALWAGTASPVAFTAQDTEHTQLHLGPSACAWELPGGGGEALSPLWKQETEAVPVWELLCSVVGQQCLLWLLTAPPQLSPH